MAEKINVEEFADADKEFIQQTLMVNDEEMFFVENGQVFLPLAFARTRFELESRQILETESVSFLGELRTNQMETKNETLRDLKTDGFSIISSAPGFGKTITALNIACELKLTTLIVVNKLILIQQWKESIEKFTYGKARTVRPSDDKLDEGVSFFIVNALNIRKKSVDFWKRIGFLIVDELHQIVTPILSNGLLKIVPNFVLGLSATPFRFDDYDKAISWFFGSKLNGESLRVKHHVKIISTEFKPLVKFTRQGIDWNAVLNDQCENEKRNILLVDSVASFSERTWLILVKRVVHASSLVKLFEERHGLKCATLTGSSTVFDKTKRILIGTTSKIGVGFDHVAIDALCVAADVKNYFVQFLGRCMRRPDCVPLVLDFRDNFGPLLKHLNERVSEYKKYGGIVESFKQPSLEAEKPFLRMLKSLNP